MQLSPSSYPRLGYRQSLGASWLSGGTGERTHIPSFRIDAEWSDGQTIDWRAAVSRLARPNAVVTAAMGGVGASLRRGRVTVRPFVEGGFATVEARVDRGGYYILTPLGSEYIPAWSPNDATGVGGGTGVSAQLYLPFRVMAEVTAAKWRFSLPSTIELPEGTTIGVGLRLGTSR
jgi:hypothetical protein